MKSAYTTKAGKTSAYQNVASQKPNMALKVTAVKGNGSTMQGNMSKNYNGMTRTAKTVASKGAGVKFTRSYK